MFGLFGGNRNNEIKEAIKNGALLVDVRSQMEFRMGTAPKAINIPLENLSNQINKLKDKEPIVLFCRSGNRSGMAVRMLQNQGFEKVYNGGTWQGVTRMVESV